MNNENQPPSLPAVPDTKEEEATANVHVEHFFPKGYDPKAEPWVSISRFCDSLEKKETGGRNALNLQRTLEALNPLADNFGHWFAGMSEEDKKKPCTFSPLTWADAERAWDARRLVEDALQSVQAASDGKEQGGHS